MTSVSSVRPAGLATIAGGLILLVSGLVATIDADVVNSVWFCCSAVASGLVVGGLLGLKSRWSETAGRPAHRSLVVAAIAFSLFGLAHVYAIADEDTAILLFSVFMVVGSLAMVVAGIALIRTGAGRGWRRSVPLLCGAWPLATIPAGAAIGDVPHFLAITVWGACWIALGASLVTAGSPIRSHSFGTLTPAPTNPR